MKRLIWILIPALLLLFPRPMVDPTQYTPNPAGVLSPAEQGALEDILRAAEAGEAVIPADPEADLHKLLTHLGLHFGTMENVWHLLWEHNGLYYLDLRVFERFERTRIAVEAKVEEALMHIQEGSDRYKLRQIARYLANRITYTNGVRETLDGFNGNGVCATYAMLFYKMASRLGIECYICYGYAGGGYHAWNMVVLDGEVFYYDITWFDAMLPDYRYLYSPDNWGREETLNDLWAGSQ